MQTFLITTSNVLPIHKYFEANFKRQTATVEKKNTYQKCLLTNIPGGKSYVYLSKPIYTFLGFCSLIFFSLLQCVLILINISFIIVDYKFTEKNFLKPTFNLLCMQTVQRTYNLKQNKI